MDNQNSDITELTPEERQAVDAEIIRAKRASKRQPDILDAMQRDDESVSEYLERRGWIFDGEGYVRESLEHLSMPDSRAIQIQAERDQPRIIAAYKQLQSQLAAALIGQKGFAELHENYTNLKVELDAAREAALAECESIAKRLRGRSSEAQDIMLAIRSLKSTTPKPIRSFAEEIEEYFGQFPADTFTGAEVMRIIRERNDNN
jgi:hypothetical protein